jgi:hypothetical protein
MRKDWIIIRQILLRLEDSATPNTVLRPDHFENFPPQEVAYNMRLLAEAGLIEANIQELRNGSGEIGAAIARRLTNSGHDLLDTIRNDTVWKKIKDTFRDKGLDMTFDLVLSVGKEIAKQILLG